MKTLHLTLKITTAHVVETSVSYISLSKDYFSLTRTITQDEQLLLLGSNHLLMTLKLTTLLELPITDNAGGL